MGGQSLLGRNWAQNSRWVAKVQNNIQWDGALIKQVQRYKRDGTVPRLADRNFREIDLAISLEAGKITFTNKDTI